METKAKLWLYKKIVSIPVVESFSPFNSLITTEVQKLMQKSFANPIISCLMYFLFNPVLFLFIMYYAHL